MLNGVTKLSSDHSSESQRPAVLTPTPALNLNSPLKFRKKFITFISKACLCKSAVYWDFMNKCQTQVWEGQSSKILSLIFSKKDSGGPYAQSSAALCYLHLAHLRNI